MQVWKRLRIVVLGVALGVLGWVLYSRGNPTTLGGRPARIQSAYRTEEAWIVTEILAAITELTTRGGSATFVAPATTAPDHVYTVDTAGVVRVDLRDVVWSPAAFEAVARAALGGATAETAAPLDVHRGLLTPGPEPVVAAAAAAGARLTRSTRDAAAHEAAAMAVAAFGLREAAGAYYSDLRPALNRLTAHLALAAALRHGEAPSMDGRIAQLLLDALANHGARVTAGASAMPSGTGDTRAWTTVARLRVTDDWRLVARPEAATRPEQREYFRARRATLPGLSVQRELARLQLGGSREIEWDRITRSFSGSVEDAGDAVDDAFARELAEAVAVHRAMGFEATPAPKDAVRLFAEGAVDDATAPAAMVLPWRLWSGQIQRHLTHGVAEVDRFMRHRLGADRAADLDGYLVNWRLASMPLFPLGALGRTTGTNGGLGDFRFIREGIAIAARSPESMQYPLWKYLELASRYEPVAERMPVWSAWFTPPGSRFPYESGHRAAGDQMADVETLAGLVAAAPDAAAVPGAYLRARYGATLPAADLERVLGARLDYDARTLAFAAGFSHGETRFGFQERACALVARECVALGRMYADAGRARDAERSYLHGFDDPDYDTVSLANMMPWLVEHYAATGRLRDAVALAERGASSGAYMGHLVASRIAEQDGDFDRAEAHAQDAARYDSPGDLFGFYYRAVNIHGRAAYRSSLDGLRDELFPDGLQKVPDHLSAPPAKGVLVYRDSEFSRTHGVQAGDIIIGVEGWKVDDQRQYRAASGTAPTNLLKLTLWRGQVLQVELRAAARLMGVEFRNHPMTGWTD